MAQHPTSGLSEVVHQRHRLGILTITAEASQAEFGYLRTALDLTAGNLSRHLTVLEDAGLITVEKGYAGRRPRTWIHITRAGRRALAAEMEALSALVREHSVRPETGSARADVSGVHGESGGGRPVTESDRAVPTTGKSPRQER